MWFLGLAEGDRQSAAAGPSQGDDEVGIHGESMIAALNAQMVEAKLLLEAERGKNRELTEQIQRLKTEFRAEKVRWVRDTELLQEQVGELSRRNNDLVWSNEELLQMMHSSESYQELQDTRDLMRAVKQLAEELHRKRALLSALMGCSRRDHSCRAAMLKWVAFTSASVARENSLQANGDFHTSPSQFTNGSSVASTEQSPPCSHFGKSSPLPIIGLKEHIHRSSEGSGVNGISEHSVVQCSSKQHGPLVCKSAAADDERAHVGTKTEGNGATQSLENGRGCSADARRKMEQQGPWRGELGNALELLKAEVEGVWRQVLHHKKQRDEWDPLAVKAIDGSADDS